MIVRFKTTVSVQKMVEKMQMSNIFDFGKIMICLIVIVAAMNGREMPSCEQILTMMMFAQMTLMSRNMVETNVKMTGLIEQMSTLNWTFTKAGGNMIDLTRKIYSKSFNMELRMMQMQQTYHDSVRIVKQMLEEILYAYRFANEVEKMTCSILLMICL